MPPLSITTTGQNCSAFRTTAIAATTNRIASVLNQLIASGAFNRASPQHLHAYVFISTGQSFSVLIANSAIYLVNIQTARTLTEKRRGNKTAENVGEQFQGGVLLGLLISAPIVPLLIFSKYPLEQIFSDETLIQSLADFFKYFSLYLPTSIIFTSAQSFCYATGEHGNLLNAANWISALAAAGVSIYWAHHDDLTPAHYALNYVIRSSIRAAFMLTVFAFSKKLKDYRLLYPRLGGAWQAAKDLAKQGFPASVDYSLRAVFYLAMSGFAHNASSDAAAALGAIFFYLNIFNIPRFGVIPAIRRLISTHRGNNNYELVKHTIKLALLSFAGIDLFFMILGIPLRHYLIKLLTSAHMGESIGAVQLFEQFAPWVFFASCIDGQSMALDSISAALRDTKTGAFTAFMCLMGLGIGLALATTSVDMGLTGMMIALFPAFISDALLLAQNVYLKYQEASGESTAPASDRTAANTGSKPFPEECNTWTGAASYRWKQLKSSLWNCFCAEPGREIDPYGIPLSTQAQAFYG